MGLPGTLVRQRPDMREAEAKLHAATAQTGVAVANFYPDVTLVGAANFQSLAIRDAFNIASRAYNVGPKAAALCRKLNDELAGIVQSDSALLQPLAPASRGGAPAADQAIPDGHGCRRARLARVDAILLDQERAFVQISALRCDTI